jgi:hypothetical protein
MCEDAITLQENLIVVLSLASSFVKPSWRTAVMRAARLKALRFTWLPIRP